MNWKFLFVVILVLSYLYGCSKDDTTGPTANNTSSVTIGTQVWMAKNLDVDHYANGDPIPQVTDQNEWASLSTGAWCYYVNNSDNGKVYGKLYNWFAVNDPRGLTPEDGWHIPTLNEWKLLLTFLGGANVAGGKLKQSGTALWQSPNTGATNESGFNALPSGFRNSEGVFYNLGVSANWWTSSNLGPIHGSNMHVESQTLLISENGDDKKTGFSVRCIKNLIK